MLKTSMGLKSVYDPEALNRELALVTGAGFDTVDLDISEKYPLEMLHDANYLERAKAARRVLDDFGMKVYMGHSPFPLHFDGDPEREEKMRQDVFRSIEAASVLGIGYMIVHPYYAFLTSDPLFDDREAQLDINLRLFGEFVPFAEKMGVHISTENCSGYRPGENTAHRSFGSTAEDLNAMMDAVPGLSVCLDYGHALVSRLDPVRMVYDFGSRLTNLHLHNNDHTHDLHLAPLQTYEADWGSFCRALHGVGYKGTVNLECFSFISACPPKMRAASYTYLHATAQYLAELIENA